MTKLEQLEMRVEELEKAMARMQSCAMVIKGITQELSGVDIDKEVARAMIVEDTVKDIGKKM